MRIGRRRLSECAIRMINDDAMTLLLMALSLSPLYTDRENIMSLVVVRVVVVV